MTKVNIIETETGEVVNEIEAKDFRSAEKLEKGVNINLNHDQYHTVIVHSAFYYEGVRDRK